MAAPSRLGEALAHRRGEPVPLLGTPRPGASGIVARPSLARVLLPPTTLALVVRLVLWVSLPPSPAWDGVPFERAAEDIAAGRGFTRAMFSRDQPPIATAFYPVGLPAALAVIRTTGAGRQGDLLFQCVVGVLTVPVGYALGRRLGGRRTGALTAWLAALWPGGVLLSLSWMTEPLFSLLVATSSAIIAWSSFRTRTRSLALAVGVLSLATYVRPSGLVVAAALVLATLWIDRRQPAPFRRAGIHVALSLVVASSILAPWALRNAAAIGTPIPVSTNGGFNLLLGTTGDGRFGEMPADIDCPAALGEVAKDRCRADRALARISDRPLHALARGALKLVHTFGHESSPSEIWASSLELDDEDRASARLFALAVSQPFWLSLLVASGAGGVLVWRRRPMGAPGAAILAPLAGTALVHAVYLGGDRYHAPTVLLLCALAAFAIVELRRTRA